MPVVRIGLTALTVASVLATTTTLGNRAAASDEIVVRPGDTLTAIAIRHGVAVAALVKANGISNPNLIYAGEKLVISGAMPSSGAKPASGEEAAGAGAGTHTVKAGDNLWSIARYYGVSLSELIRLNDIADASRIRPGMPLRLPGAASAPVAAKSKAEPKANANSPTAPKAMAMPAWMADLTKKREPVGVVIAEEARRLGVPVPLALAVAWQESGWRQDVTSSAGAVGVMQLMPGTAEWIGESMLGRPVKIDDLRDNVRGGVTLLAFYLERYDGDQPKVLAAYYQGMGAVDRHGIYPVSRPYIASVTALVRMFGG